MNEPARRRTGVSRYNPRAHLVVLKRVARPLRLLGRQVISVIRGCVGRILGGIAGLSIRGEREQNAGQQDRGEEFVRHEGLFEYVHDRKTGIGICLRARVMSDRPFSPLSYVGSLPLWRLSLGICRITKIMPQRLIAGNFEIVARM
jgi:hypothetical protein